MTANRPAYQALKYRTTLAYVPKSSPVASAVRSRLGTERKFARSADPKVKDGGPTVTDIAQHAVGFVGAGVELTGRQIVSFSMDLRAEWQAKANYVRNLPVVGPAGSWVVSNTGRGLSALTQGLGTAVSLGGKTIGVGAVVWGGVTTAERQRVRDQHARPDVPEEIQEVRARFVGLLSGVGAYSVGAAAGAGCVSTGVGVWVSAACVTGGSVAGGSAGEWVGQRMLDAFDTVNTFLSDSTE